MSLLIKKIDLFLTKQLLTFTVIGVFTVSIDYFIYISLLNKFNIVILAKITGYVLATSFAFFANKKWTFKNKKNSISQIIKFLFLYILTMAINSSVNSFFLDYLSGHSATNLSFIIATGISAILNFAGMKIFIFTHDSSVQKK